MRWLIRKNGQTFLEYVAVIACVIAALLAMQHYIQRAVQGRLREAADQIGDQYEPGKTEGLFTTIVSRDVLTQVIQDVPVTLDPADGTPTLSGTATLTLETTNYDDTYREGFEIVGP